MFGNGAATGAAQMAFNISVHRNQSQNGFEQNDFSDEVQTNSTVARRSTAITIDAVKVVDLGSYTVSADAAIPTKDAQAYVDIAQRGWSHSSIDTDGTVIATSLRLRLVSTAGDFRLKPCIPLICTSGLGAADLGGSVAYLSSSQRANTPIHEFGHMFGLQHQWAGTRSIMSAASDRAVQMNDLKRIVQTYQRKNK
jgi:hypothetical protein